MGRDYEPCKPVNEMVLDSRTGRRKLGAVLFSLNHVIDFEWVREAYIRTRKDGATGIDGVTAQDYETNLEANLRDLLERIKSGGYKAPPVRRTYIPKADGSQRPLGIPMRRA
jgi:RNA-directed DNA polymerase